MSFIEFCISYVILKLGTFAFFLTKKKKKKLNFCEKEMIPWNENTSSQAENQGKRSSQDIPSLVGSHTKPLRLRRLEIRRRSKCYRWWWKLLFLFIFGGSERGFRGACCCSNGECVLWYFAEGKWSEKWGCWWWEVESCGHGSFLILQLRFGGMWVGIFNYS